MSPKRPEKIQGYFCRADGKFYYLDAGRHTVRSPLDRIRSSLLARGLAPASEEPLMSHEAPLRVMNLDEALREKYPVECIYLNHHVGQVEANKDVSPTVSSQNPWAKPND